MKRFNLADVPDGAICVFVGKRKSGKSFCMRDFIYNKRDIPQCWVLSGTEHVNPFFSDFIPSTFIKPEFIPDDYDMIFKRQEMFKKKMIKNPKKFGGADPRIMIVFDDMLHDNSWKKSKQVANIFMNGRHSNITFVLAMQYTKGIPPSLRGNVDYAFIFRDSSEESLKKMYECFGGPCGTLKKFKSLVKNLDMYECLVICQTADKIKFEDQVKIYKAVDNGDFKFGSKKMWDYHRKKIKENKIKAREQRIRNHQEEVKKEEMRNRWNNRWN